MDLSQFKQKFIDEASSLLTNLDNVLIDLENDPVNKQGINETFRVMHTIKGASGMYGFEPIVKLTHELESLYDIIRENNLPVSQPLFELTFSAVDIIRVLLHDEECTEVANIERFAQIMSGIEIIKTAFNAPAPEKRNIEVKDNTGGVSSWNIIFYPNDELISRAVNLVYTFQDLFQLGEYKIYQQPVSSKSDLHWNIFLVTDKGYDEIEAALMFIMDYCKISKIADFNILDPKEFDKRNMALENTLQDDEPLKITEQILNIDPKNTPDLTIAENIKVQAAPSTLGKVTSSHINVNAAKLDTLMFLVSELVTAKSELIIALQKKNEEKALDTAEKIEKLSKLFSENALSIRLVSLSEMMGRFKRLVRDLSKQLNKSINFVTMGDDTELDKSIIDHIGEPVMHLIRNCIDHGIESPEKRLERGKPETGNIRFEAATSGNSVYIFIGDDGNGIDTDYVYNKAVEKGFIAAGTVLSREEILNLIFLPGFSTAQALTNISGRGVGMDIVLRKIEEIRGEITVTSNKGAGTTFTIKLQQTISILDTLLIESGNSTYAIPMEDIESCVLEAKTSLVDRQNKVINYNNSLIPFLNLRNKSGLIENLANDNEFEKMVVITKHNRTYGLIADKIIGEYQAVIKPLGQTFNSLKFLSGASLLGDGSIALLVDTEKLWFEITH